MKVIRKIRLFPNKNDKSIEVAKELSQKLINNGYIIDNDCDLAIAIGGDGAFLRMIKKLKYDSNLLYVGINTGTLGFLQEISDINYFIDSLKNKKYKIEEVGIQETTICNDKTKRFKSLNEIVIREKDLNTVSLIINVNGNLLESYVGDGILVATSVGSTAYNLSFGGSIIYNTLHTLQITPIAPLNSKAYRNLLNSIVIPEKAKIRIIPKTKDLLISIDGENKIVLGVNYIETKIDKKRINIMHFNNYNYFKTINDKFLSN